MTQGADGEMLLLFDESLMTIWDANQLPLVGNLALMPEPFRSSTAAANDRSEDLYPRGLERENIGSINGLARFDGSTTIGAWVQTSAPSTQRSPSM